MRLNIQDNKLCCGCSACESICPHKAITMESDFSGFLYPSIDANKCVDCGLCIKVCQFKYDYTRYNNFDIPYVYAGRQKQLKEVAKSQTGGLAALMYKQFIETGGFVYGVTFDENQHIVFKGTGDKQLIEQFRGSKYVQADIRGIFSQIKNQIKEGKHILFVGTPCQVAGLKSFLPDKLHDNLLTVDLICHCNTSPGLWKSYVEYLEKKYKAKIIKADFRNKRYGWHKCLETYSFNNGKEIVTGSYDYLFFAHLSSRPSCVCCPYTNLKRVSDITIGDYWGWEKNHIEWNDNLGLNLILVNSLKGKEFFKTIEVFLDYKQTNIRDCLQPQLIVPIKNNPLQDKFFKDYSTKGIKYVIYKYGDKNYIFRLKVLLKRIKQQILHL